MRRVKLTRTNASKTRQPGSGTEASHPSGLPRLDTQPSGKTYRREIRQLREFTIRMPVHEMRAKNLDSTLGMMWFILNPLLSVAVYFIFFGLVLGTDRGVDNFITFLGAGVFTYTYMQRSIMSASKTMITNIGLIRAIKFPRAILPISETIEHTLTQIPVLVALLVVAIVTGETPHVRWLALIPLLILQSFFSLGVGFILARWTSTVRDIQNLIPFIFRLVFYMSGVLYSVENFVSDEALRRIFFLNPFYDHVSLVRWAVLGDETSLLALVAAMVFSFLFLGIGFSYFRRGEPYGRA